MDYDGLEIEIVGVLNTYFGATLLSNDPPVYLSSVYSARLMPDNPADLLQDYNTTVVNVAYYDSTFSEPQSTAQISQQEHVHVACHIQGSLVRIGTTGVAKTGTNGCVWAVIRALMGYKPAGATTRMWVSDMGGWKVNEADGEVKPLVEFTFRTIAEQALCDVNTDFIDSINTVVESGPEAEIDSTLYVLPGPVYDPEGDLNLAI